jgi:cell division septum initiation protein DivIVA
MAQDAERTKSLVSFKQKLEKRIQELESELKEFQSMLEAVNSILLEKGFKRAEIAKAPTVEEALAPKGELEVEHEPLPLQHSTEYESATLLKTVSGTLLATLYMSEDSLHVVPARDKNFNINTPPFSHFLLQKVFAKMQEKDNALVREGQLNADKVLSYDIVREGDIIREITIKHVDQDRLRELKSSIRWTLEKMHEKAMI